MTDIGPSQMKMSDGCPGIFKAPGSSMIRQLQRNGAQKQWISGNGFWDKALLLYETLFAESLDKRFNQWLNTLGRYRMNRETGSIAAFVSAMRRARI